MMPLMHVNRRAHRETVVTITQPHGHDPPSGVVEAQVNSQTSLVLPWLDVMSL